MGLRINFFGGPGVGKTTMAALLFGWLRQQGFQAELVQEWIKSWAYMGRRPRSFDYVYTFANQLHTEDRLLQAGVNILVTDSPVLLQCMYALRHETPAAEELRRVAERFEVAHPSVNFFVDRSETVAYRQAGRFEDLDEAMAMDRFIAMRLDEWRVPFKHVQPGELDLVLGALDEQYGMVRHRAVRKKLARNATRATAREDRQTVLQALTDLGVEYGFVFFGLSFIEEQIIKNGKALSTPIHMLLDRLCDKGDVHRAGQEGDFSYAIDHSLAAEFMA